MDVVLAAWVVGQESQITRINRDNILYPAILVRHSCQERGKCLVAIVQTHLRGITIQWPRPGGCVLCAIPIYNVDRLHYSTLRCNLNHRQTGRSPLTVTRVPERVCGQ
jgi:hypothetical protein